MANVIWRSCVATAWNDAHAFLHSASPPVLSLNLRFQCAGGFAPMHYAVLKKAPTSLVTRMIDAADHDTTRGNVLAIKTNKHTEGSPGSKDGHQTALHLAVAAVHTIDDVLLLQITSPRALPTSPLMICCLTAPPPSRTAITPSSRPCATETRSPSSASSRATRQRSRTILSGPTATIVAGMRPRRLSTTFGLTTRRSATTCCSGL